MSALCQKRTHALQQGNLLFDLVRESWRVATSPNLDDWPRSAHRWPRKFSRFSCFQNVGEADTIVFGPDCLEPMTHIAPQYERIRGGRSALLLVADESGEWNGSEIHLFGSHFNQLWDGNSHP